MEYISTAEASEKWGTSLRQVQRLLADKRIPRAKKYGGAWMIPVDANKPADPRRQRSLPGQSLSSDLAHVIASTATPMPVNNPDAILDALSEERLRLIYEAELAYLRGDFEQAMSCYQKTGGDDAVRLRICPLAIAAAISMGDYRTYREIESYLMKCIETNKGSEIAAFAENSLATAIVSVIAPNMAPDWLKAGDLGALPPQLRPNALYLRAKYFHGLGQYDAMLAVALTALALSSPEGGITTTDIYLRATGAVACHALERDGEAKCRLLEAMRLALPHGLITPFAENVTALGGLTEQCLEQEFPSYYEAVIEQWQRTWKYWATFHNQFTKDNITLILSLREYHIALLVARRIPYAKIARQYGISVGRLKNIMLEIYEKLFISSRDELAKFVM